MPTYNLKTEQASYEVRLRLYQETLERIESGEAGASAAPPQPTPPAVYTGTEVTEPTEITTPYGPTIVLPPSIVMSGPHGEFGILPEALAVDYTEV